MKLSAIEKAIEALEKRKDEHARVIDLAIAELVAQRGTAKVRTPRAPRKAKKTEKETL